MTISIDESRYDPVLWSGFFACCGYESRSTHISKLLAGDLPGAVLVHGFLDNKVLSYEENADWYRAKKLEVVEVDDGRVVDDFEAWLSSLEGEYVFIGVDISSLNRRRMADIFKVLYLESRKRSISVDVMYSVAHPLPGSLSTTSGPFREIGSISPFFGGWKMDTGIPTALIVGVGYEKELVVGIVEYLQTDLTLAFRTMDRGDGYYDQVSEANRLLWISISEGNVYEYPLGFPESALTLLDNVVRDLVEDHRIVFLPMGPKIFTALALIVALRVYPAATVVRAISIDAPTPQERIATGEVVSFRVTFQEGVV